MAKRSVRLWGEVGRRKRVVVIFSKERVIRGISLWEELPPDWGLPEPPWRGYGRAGRGSD